MSNVEYGLVMHELERGDLVVVDARCLNTVVQYAARNGLPEISIELFKSGALRNRVGSHWRSHGLLRLRPAIFTVPQAVSRQADCLASTGTGKTGVDDQ